MVATLEWAPGLINVSVYNYLSTGRKLKDKWIDRQIDVYIDRQIDVYIDRQMHIQIDR